MSDPMAVQGMARFGIKSGIALGISIPNLYKMATQNDKMDWQHCLKELTSQHIQ